MHRRPSMRARRRALCGWPLSCAVALHVPPAMGAAFLPGPTLPDPPTGAVATTSAPPPAPSGPGIEWRFGPWRYRGSLALDWRALRDGDGLRSRQGLIVGDIEFANHVWQPWFLQLRAGIGMVVARGQSTSGGEPAVHSGSEGLNGNMALSLFPASRFPFELRMAVTDSRSQADADAVGTDYRMHRLTLSQSYRPEVGNDHLRLNLNLSRVTAADGRSDRLSVLEGGWTRQTRVHGLELDLSHSRYARPQTGTVQTQSLLSMRHGFTPSHELLVDTLLTWNRADRRERQALAAASFDTEVRQVSSVATWRPDAAEGEAPLLVGASARLLDASAAGGGDVQAFNASLGASQDPWPDWRASAQASVGVVQAGPSARSSNAALGGSLGWVPAGIELGEWRYSPSGQASLSLAQATGSHRRSVGLQGAHGLSRDLELDGAHRLSFNLTQSLGTLVEAGEPAATDLAHTASVYWQHSGDEGSQRYASLSVSDARSIGEDRGTFQLVNLQVNQRTRLSRYSSLSANVTVQASRSSTAQVDPFSGELRVADPTWRATYSASVSADVQNVFGVPRLRYSLFAGATSQRLERREAGDIDAPLDHVSASVEQRLDYAIGRLEARLSARVARVEDRTVGSVFVRLQRRF